VNYRAHGLVSILLFYAALSAGMAAIWPHSRVLALCDLGIIVLGTLGIVYSFCAKCPCHAGHCSHILLGKLTRLVPRRRIIPYTRLDIAGLIVSALVLVLFPQPWLRSHAILWAAFWVAAAAAVGDILPAVCPSCRNVRCPLKPGR
jgi:hypothetical protein